MRQVLDWIYIVLIYFKNMFKPKKLNAGVELKNILEAENKTIKRRVNTTFDIKQAVNTVPTHIPKNNYESIVYYVNDTTYRIYFYMGATAGWRYVALT